MASGSITNTNTDSVTRVTLERDGKRVDLQLEQVTADNIRRIFQVNNY